MPKNNLAEVVESNISTYGHGVELVKTKPQWGVFYVTPAGKGGRWYPTEEAARLAYNAKLNGRRNRS
jgi:hypothetical protein